MQRNNSLLYLKELMTYTVDICDWAWQEYNPTQQAIELNAARIKDRMPK